MPGTGTCREHQLTSYDAANLELAMRAHHALATVDDALIKRLLRKGRCCCDLSGIFSFLIDDVGQTLRVPFASQTPACEPEKLKTTYTGKCYRTEY